MQGRRLLVVEPNGSQPGPNRHTLGLMVFEGFWFIGFWATEAFPERDFDPRCIRGPALRVFIFLGILKLKISEAPQT